MQHVSSGWDPLPVACPLLAAHSRAPPFSFRGAPQNWLLCLGMTWPFCLWPCSPAPYAGRLQARSLITGPRWSASHAMPQTLGCWKQLLRRMLRAFLRCPAGLVLRRACVYSLEHAEPASLCRALRSLKVALGCMLQHCQRKTGCEGGPGIQGPCPWEICGTSVLRLGLELT